MKFRVQKFVFIKALFIYEYLNYFVLVLEVIFFFILFKAIALCCFSFELYNAHYNKQKSDCYKVNISEFCFDFQDFISMDHDVILTFATFSLLVQYLISGSFTNVLNMMMF